MPILTEFLIILRQNASSNLTANIKIAAADLRYIIIDGSNVAREYDILSLYHLKYFLD